MCGNWSWQLLGFASLVVYELALLNINKILIKSWHFIKFTYFRYAAWNQRFAKCAHFFGAHIIDGFSLPLHDILFTHFEGNTTILNLFALLVLELWKYFGRRIFIDHLVFISINFFEKWVGKGLLRINSFLWVYSEHFFHQVHCLVRNFFINVMLKIKLACSILFY